MNSSDITIRETSIREKENKKKSSSWKILGIAGQLGFDVAIPITLGTVAGRGLDQVFHTYPKLTISLLTFGLVISIVNFVRIIRKILSSKDL